MFIANVDLFIRTSKFLSRLHRRILNLTTYSDLILFLCSNIFSDQALTYSKDLWASVTVVVSK